MHVPILRAALILALLAAAPPASADVTVKLDALRPSFPVSPYLEVLEDPDQRYTFGDVTTPPLSQTFTPVDARLANLGASNSAFWVRFNLKNEAHAIGEWILVYELAIVERIDLYLPTGDGVYEHQFAGLSFPVTGKQFADNP